MATTLIKAKELGELARIDETLRESRLSVAIATEAGNAITVAVVQARAVRQLRELLSPQLMSDIMQLRGTVLGFRTDKDHLDNGRGYDVDTVRECLVIAMMIGVSVVGNEWNIIGGNCYITLNGVSRIVHGWPGLTDLRLDAGVPTVAKGRDGALVPYSATWKLNGQPDAIECSETPADTRIPVRVNKGMGADAILGKARRKMLARIWERLRGTDGLGAVAEIDDPTAGNLTVESVEPPAEESPIQPAADAVPTSSELPF